MRRLALPLCFSLALACGEKAQEGQERPQSSAEVQPPQAEGEAALASAPDPQCEPSPHFEDLEWLAESRFSLLVATQDEALAKTLEALSAGGLAADPPLPVFANFELQNLSLELRTLALVYEPLGLAPQELLKVHGPKQESLWFLPAPCDHSALEARAQARWGVKFRGDGGARIGIAPADAALPFDLLLLPGGRMALLPRGRSGAVQRWLSSGGKKDQTLTGGHAEGPPPGRELSTLPPAPLRLRLSGRALGASHGGRQLLTLSPDAVERHATAEAP